MTTKLALPAAASGWRQRRTWLRRLLRDTDGVTAIEFSVCAPVFLILMLGILDIGHMVYAKSVLSGAVQKAARESSLETANTSEADAIVEGIVSKVLPGATYDPLRTSYFDFDKIGRPEAWNDRNGNGTCDNREPYTDENNNESWDADVGEEGNGGASDVVVYTMTVTYSPIFKIPFSPDNWGERSISASTVKKNQPFADQGDVGSTAGTCDDE